ncbi:2-hydroxyacid dehydrogenase [Piscinibacter sp.]|jgi:glyoxylate/hydroxypyruvate reductase A|uniref:2-hydroxyacid dehydrogenase n=1 Tax=Piscinibacter sp. TaxID=1903157 RepID=UPI002F3FE12D
MAILLATDFGAAELALWSELLQTELPAETLVSDRMDCDPGVIDIAIVANPPPGALSCLPNLRLIQSLWAGVDTLLRDPTLPAGVPIARMVDPAMNQAMAQTALWAVLSLQRDFFTYAAQQRAMQWLPHPQRRADEVSVAVLGLGQMGQAAARRLAGNGYRVSGWSTREVAVPDVATGSGEAALARVLGDASIVVNLLPLTPATTGLFDRTRFAQMRRGAGFVNLARGAQVVDADLLAALDSGQLRHAVLDVFHSEPLPAGHRFWTHPQVTLLPHVAAQTDPRSAAPIAASNVHALREGRALQHLVDRRRGY